MRKQQGFTLVELALVLIIMGLMVTMLIPAASSQIDGQRRKETIRKMTVIDEALLAFVMANRRLPCPADGGALTGTSGAGIEVRNGNGDCGDQRTGVVPWVSLGLSESDATDGYFARFTYRVPPDGPAGLTRNGALDAASCDPAGGAPASLNAFNARSCNQPCDRSNMAQLAATCTSSSSLLTGRGLRVSDQGGNVINNPNAVASTGAAYVLISHMAEGGGGFNSSGTTTSSSIAPGTGESFNQNNQPVIDPALGGGYFHSSQIFTGEGSGANHFDDLLSHPTILQLMAKAHLAPRSQ